MNKKFIKGGQIKNYKDFPSYFIATCEYCGREFYPAKRSAKYCSNSCKQMAYLERKKRSITDEPEQASIPHHEIHPNQQVSSSGHWSEPIDYWWQLQNEFHGPMYRKDGLYVTSVDLSRGCEPFPVYDKTGNHFADIIETEDKTYRYRLTN